MNKVTKQIKQKRTRTGCLCCRRRHKKCDEMKPSCKFCISKGLECEWPKMGQVFVNNHVQKQNTTIDPKTEEYSSESDSNKSSIDYGYRLSVELPPIKHYHMVIPRNPPQSQPQKKQNYLFKNPFVNGFEATVPTTSVTNEADGIGTKRLSVDSLLN